MKKLISALLLTAMLLTAFSSTFTVSAAAETILTTNKTTYTQGEPILVTAKSENSSGKDWLGITVKGDETGAAIYWDYLSDITENYDISKATHKGKNREQFYGLPAGEYTVFIIPNDLSVKNGLPQALPRQEGASLPSVLPQALAKVDITIVASDSAPEIPTVLTTDKSVYTVDEKILVTATHANKNGTDWVGIIPKGGTDGAAIYWAYLSAIEDGFDISLGKKGKNMDAYYSLPAGEYTLMIIENDQTVKKGFATAPITLDITIVDAAPEATEPESSTKTGDSFVIFAAIAVLSVFGVAFVSKRKEI